jgi:hypothetical protein
MRPIAVLSAGPWCFPDAIVVSPGQGPMQRRLAGYDLPGAGRSARGHRTDGGVSGEGANSGQARAVPATRCPSGRQVRLLAGQQAGDAGQRSIGGRVAQFGNFDKDPMERRTVAEWQASRFVVPSRGVSPGDRAILESRTRPYTTSCGGRWQAGTLRERRRTFSRPSGATRASRTRPHTTSHGGRWRASALGRPSSGMSPAERCKAGISDKTLYNVPRWPMAGRDARRAVERRVPGRVAQFAQRGQDPMQRRAAGLGGWRARSGGRRAARSRPSGATRASRTRPYTTSHGGRWQAGTLGEPSSGVSPAERHNSRASDKTLCNVARLGLVAGVRARSAVERCVLGRAAQSGHLRQDCVQRRAAGLAGDRALACHRTVVPRPTGAIRDSLQRPYGTPRGGVGGNGSRVGGQGIGRRPNGAIREFRQRPYGTARGGVGGREPGGRPSDLSPAAWRDARFSATTLWNAARRTLAAGRSRDLSPAGWRDFENLDKDHKERRAVGWRWPGSRGRWRGPVPGPSGGNRECRQGPYGSCCGGRGQVGVAGAVRDARTLTRIAARSDPRVKCPGACLGRSSRPKPASAGEVKKGAALPFTSCVSPPRGPQVRGWPRLVDRPNRRHLPPLCRTS